ncbi:MAG: hypothetical protein K2N90_05740, partial [Lachnospiraceae bacterium]|nr:hypothetical protein [Lachnospiraceae bacterium]
MSNHIVTMLKGIVEFASVYCFSKCMKTLLCGLCLMPVVMLIRRALRRKNAILCCYLWLLLVPMALMGMSRLFYQKYFVYVTAYLGKYGKAWQGYVYFGVMLALMVLFIVKNIKFRCALKKMPQIYETCAIKQKVKIYVSEMDAGPFSGGIISPYIVVPKGVWESLDKESRDVIIR